MVEYVKLELGRDPDFRSYCADMLTRVRAHVSDLPAATEACLSTCIDGVCLARLLLDGYNARCVEEQWKRARRLSGT